MRRYVTVDGTRIHCYKPETKEQSKQWISPGEKAPKKANTVHPPERSWPPFLDSQGIIHIDSIWIREKLTQKNIIALYLIDSTLNWRNNGSIWRRRKSSFTTTTHCLTGPPLQSLNWSNCATNCSPTHRILQTKPPAIISCFQTWKNGWPGRNLHQMTRSSLKKRPI